MKRVVGVAAMLLCVAAAPDMPDRRHTPGAINPEVTQTNIGSTICVPGWTSTIRPPSSYTSLVKHLQIAQLGLTDRTPSHYEEDHLISLELGGAPRNQRNLWPEPWEGKCGAHVKDRLENVLKAKVCAGKLLLKDAQESVAVDWQAAYRAHIGPLSCH